MIKRIKPTLLGFLLASLPASATISINIDIASMYDAQGNNTAVSDGTFWIAIQDDGDGLIAGMSSAGSGQSIVTSGTADSFFTAGQTVTIGNNLAGGSGGDIIFAMGTTNESAFGIAGSMSRTLGSMPIDGEPGAILTSGRTYGIFWFSDASAFAGGGVNTTVGISHTIGSEVGGITSQVSEVGGQGPMLLPSSGTETHGAVDTASFGTRTLAEMNSVTLVPEPSSALLAMLGSLMLLRRRRQA